ncbi:MAG: 4Fe-4S binding protein [Promethearchaeota archaeon]
MDKKIGRLRTWIGRLVKGQPSIGKLLATLMGFVEVPMLDLFNFMDKHVSKHFKIRIIGRLFRNHWGGRVVPLGVNISVGTKFLPTQEIYEIISRSRVFAIGECYCRKKHHRCDNPTNTCILLGPIAGKSMIEIPYKTAIFHRVSKAKILSVLDECDKRGLVHQLIFFPSPDYYYVICNCCTCCCEVLHDFKKFLTPKVIKSDFIEQTDLEKCNGCGKCETACPFGARIVKDGVLEVITEACFGCGVCVRQCPENAIILKKREQIPA